MATYAPNGTNDSDPTQYDLISGKSPNRYHLARLFKKRNMRVISEVIDKLLDDATPASTASVTYARVQAVANTAANVQGGVRTIETVEEVSGALNTDKDDANNNTARAVSATDVTVLQGLLEEGAEQKRQPATYPVDLSGNGGGGKLS